MLVCAHVRRLTTEAVSLEGQPLWWGGDPLETPPTAHQEEARKRHRGSHPSPPKAALPLLKSANPFGGLLQEPLAPSTRGDTNVGDGSGSIGKDGGSCLHATCSSGDSRLKDQSRGSGGITKPSSAHLKVPALVTVLQHLWNPPLSTAPPKSRSSPDASPLP